MAYNNGFPVGYQPQPYFTSPQYYSQQQPITPINPNPRPISNNMIWVQGIGGAKSYLLAPNETATLWDSEAQTIYLKSADSSGMPSMKILDYVIRENQPQPNNQVPTNTPIQNDQSFATKDDLKEIREELERVNNRLNSINSNLQKKDNRKEYKNE